MRLSKILVAIMLVAVLSVGAGCSKNDNEPKTNNTNTTGVTNEDTTEGEGTSDASKVAEDSTPPAKIEGTVVEVIKPGDEKADKAKDAGKDKATDKDKAKDTKK